MSGKKKNAIMLADTRPALVGTVLCQLQKTNPSLFDEAIIYYQGELSQKARTLMNQILPCRFVRYAPPLPDELFQKPRFALFSPLMFARYEMFSYLEEFETITWLDTDILIQGDLSPMIEMAKKSGSAFIREDPIHKTAENPDRMKTCFHGAVSGYDMEQYLYCSGTIVLTDRMAGHTDCTAWCYEKTLEWANALSLPDQGVLNAAIQQFQLKPALLKGGEYCCYPYMGRDCSEATIIHSWGRNKFWNDWYIYLKYSAWKGFYEAWLSQGGEPLAFDIQPKISVLIPSYKPKETLLRQSLDSLMAQKRSDWERYSDFEIIIVAEPFDQEALQAVIDSYDDPRIHLVFNEERKGIAASLNRGFRMAQGRYIARIDDDDLAAPNRLFRQAEYLDQHAEISLCTSDFEYFGDMNERRVSFEGELSYAWSIFTCPFDHPTILFRRDFFEENSLYYDEDRGYVEDWELWRRAFAAGMKVGCIHEVLFYHRWLNTGSAGQTNKTVEMMRELVQKNFAELEVTIPTEDLPLVGPWNGKLMDDGQLSRLKNYFEKALVNNERIKRYDQESLRKVFDLRLTEAETGILPGLAEKIEKKTKQEENAAPTAYVEAMPQKRNPVKTFLCNLLKPLYRPFRHRYEDRIISIQENSWMNGGHLLDCINKLDALDAKLLQQTEQMERLEQMERRFAALEEQLERRSDALVSGLTEQLASLEAQSEKQLEEYVSAHLDAMAEPLGKIEETLHSMEEQKSQLRLTNDRLYDLNHEMRFYQEQYLLSVSQKKKALLLGTPEHSNIGDAAITLGELEFLRKYFAHYQIVELSRYDFDDWYPKLQTMVGPDDIFFLQGGGNLGNSYLIEEELRRKVISDFPKHRIIIFPQTIYFDETPDGLAQLEETKKIYHQHPQLTIFTRGAESLAFARKNFPDAQSFLAPDMALALKVDYGMKRNGVLLCMRGTGDGEAALTEDQVKYVEEAVAKVDVHFRRSNNLNCGEPDANILKQIRYGVVSDELKKFASSQVVVTDRLHGVVFAMITGTPCVAIQSYNDKITEFCQMFPQEEGLFYIGKNIEQLPPAIAKAQQVCQPVYSLLEKGLFQKMAGEIRKAGTF